MGKLFDRHADELKCVCVLTCVCVLNLYFIGLEPTPWLHLCPAVCVRSLNSLPLDFKTGTPLTQSAADVMSYTHQLPVRLRVKCSGLSSQLVMAPLGWYALSF